MNEKDVCSFLHRTASCLRASLELCFCVFSLFSVEMIRAVLTVEAQLAALLSHLQ